MDPALLATLVIAALAIAGAIAATLAWLRASAALGAERIEATRALAEARERVRGLEDAVGRQRAELTTATAETDQTRAARGAVEVQLAELRARLAGERESGEERMRLLEQTRDEMTLRFKQLSQEILEEKSQRFAEQNRLSLEALMLPLREKLTGFEQQIKQAYDGDLRDRVALKEQIAQLAQLSQQVSGDANRLAQALRGEAKTQGNWGEMILERILELSGLERGREYETQFSARDDEGQRRRPDVIVHLPQGRDVVIDAKVSLSAYVAMQDAADDAARSLALAAHLASVRNHLRELGGKSYQGLEGLGTLDFVLMFVPSEAAYIEALRTAPTLYEEALKQNIGLVGPSTLLPVLRTIENLWRTERQNRNALAIAEEAGRLYDKFVAFEQDLSRLGDALGKAQGLYRDARGKLIEGRGNVVGKIELLRKMGAKAAKQLPEPLLQHALPEPGVEE